MKIIPEADLKLPPLPLPIYKKIKIAKAVTDDGEGFCIFAGLDKELVAQLIKYSGDASDVELQKYTKDKKRFIEGSYEDWYKKSRTSFVLVHDKTGALASMMRFGSEPLFGEVDNWHTIGWRSYNLFRGRGLMKNFAQYSIDVYKKEFPNIKFWVTVKKENARSIKLAEFLGFKIDKEKSEKETMSEKKESLIMIKE